MSSATVSSFPASTVLSRSEIERIRSSVSDINSRCNASNNGSSASRREELRRLSQERQKNWPNTLEALRKKKENWKKEKLEREEAERRKIDEEEAKLREEQRRITIEKARQVKANNTDKMKLLKSKLMHAEVLDTRKQQIAEKEQRRKELQHVAVEEFQHIVEDVKAHEQEELQRQLEVIERAKQIAAVQQQQLVEEQEKRRQEQLEREALGKEYQRQAAEIVEEERRERMAKAERARLATIQIKEANKQLQFERQKKKQQEQAELEAREKEVEAIEARAAARKKLEQERFKQKQLIRQRMIDRAVEELQSFVSNENERVERQVQEAQAKKDAEDNAKEQQREELWQAIVQSRANQMQQLEEEKRQQAIENARLKEEYRRQCEAAKERERKEKLDYLNKMKELKTLQHEQHLEKRARDAEERTHRLAADSEEAGDERQEWTQFEAQVMQLIEEYEAAGKSTYPLYRALEYKQPELIPAIRRKPPKKKN